MAPATAPTRIERRFAACRAENRAALVTFLMCGDPDLATSRELLEALPAAGADIIEIGMPFTDPMADGPSIQAAGLRALKAGTTLHKTLAIVADFRRHDTDDADRPHGLLQSDLRLRRRRNSSSTRKRPASTG